MQQGYIHLFRIISSISYTIINAKTTPTTLTHLSQDLGIISSMRSANDRWRYNVTSSLIGWAHTQDDPWDQDGIITNYILTRGW